MASPWSTVEHPDASGPGVIDLDAATFLLQWAVGGLFFMWLTGRRREVGIGYGWTIRITFGLMAVGGVVVGLLFDPVPVRDASALAVVVATVVAMVVSVLRRRAGVAGQRGVEERRTARVAAMTGIDRDRVDYDDAVPEFPPWLDLVAPLLGLVGLVAGGVAAGDPALLAVALVIGFSLAMMLSPFGPSAMTLARFGRISKYTVAFGWNAPFALVCLPPIMTLLALMAWL